MTRPEFSFAFGRAPEFSLLPDGRAFYLDPAEPDRAMVMAVQLEPAEAQALLRQVLELGFERLESFTATCQDPGDGMCLCVADAGQSVLRARLPDGSLREVRNYYTFANDPEALAAIRTLLQDYRHPAAEPYVPDKAAVFARSALPPSDSAVLDWPLSPAWFTGIPSDQPCVRVLSGGDLRALLAATGRNRGDFYFRSDGRAAEVYLAPWLPGVEYADQVAASGQACPSAEGLAGGATPDTRPPARPIALEDLIIDPAELPYVAEDGSPFYRYTDLTRHHDFQEGMKNPWLMEGSELEKWNWQIKNRDIDLARVTGLLRVNLTDVSEQTAFGFDAVRIAGLSQADIDAYVNYLVRQGKERFRLYIADGILITVWSRDYPEGVGALSSWLESKFGLTPTPIALASGSTDLVPHIAADVTHDFETLAYPAKCLAKDDCDSSSVDYSCLHCPGGKFVFHNLTCEAPPGITSTDSRQGLCWQTHNMYVSDGFYTGECISTMFCLIPFEGQEVPTIHVEETRRFLPLWKEKLLEQCDASEEYFKEHFYVHSTWVVDDFADTALMVKYYFKVDWLTLLEMAVAPIRRGHEGSYLADAAVKDGFAFRLTHPITRILSKSAVQATLDECAEGMLLDENRARLTDAGRLELEAWAQVDAQANRCRRAMLDLESGEMLSCEDWACAIP